jgi:hypothetical protein
VVRVEILHTRDPDYSCEMTVWINGVRVDNVTVEDVDPGRGYEQEDWDEYTTDLATIEHYTPEFRDAVVATRNAYRDNQYIV